MPKNAFLASLKLLSLPYNHDLKECQFVCPKLSSILWLHEKYYIKDHLKDLFLEADFHIQH